MLLRQLPLLSLAALLTACGSGSGSGSGGGTSNDVFGSAAGFPALAALPANNQAMVSCKSQAPVSADSSITGVVQYQRVAITDNGLDYSAITDLPARGIIVQAVAASGNACTENVVATTLTNSLGQYGLNVPANQPVCVEARAQLYRDGVFGAAAWNVEVVDNTNARAAYYLSDQGVIATPDELGVRNLLAGAGTEVGDPASASFAEAGGLHQPRS